MATEVDILTPADREPGNPLRVRLPANAFAGALAVWSFAEGRPVWRSALALREGRSSSAAAAAVQSYGDASYFAGDYAADGVVDDVATSRGSP